MPRQYLEFGPVVSFQIAFRIACAFNSTLYNKLHNYLKITGNLNNVFGPQKALNTTRNRIIQYTGPSSFVRAYISETWTIKARDARRITAAEMKHMIITAGYIGTDYKTNTHKKKLHGLSPRANYTDRAAAAGRRS